VEISWALLHSHQHVCCSIHISMSIDIIFIELLLGYDEIGKFSPVHVTRITC
ncbi:hypothetical protein STEG23_036991, partial [Scotinomys teguina]